LKNLKLILVLSLLFMFAFSSFNYAQIKIGYIDKEVVLKQMSEYKRVEDEYKAFEKLYADTLQSRKVDIVGRAEIFQKKYEDVQQMIKSGQIKNESEAKVFEDSLTVMQDDIKKLQDNYNAYLQVVQNELMAKQNALLKPLYEKIAKIVEEVSKELKYNFVFDKPSGTLEGSLLYGDKEFDITFKVLDKLK
jgi:outer membrane protein